MPEKLSRQDLTSGWQFKQTDDHDKIPDPFIGLNELDVEWVGEKSWTYKTTIQRPTTSSGSKIALAFEGLDTFATVKLKGRFILESSNMFLSHRVDVTDVLSAAQDNTLEIDFASALLRGRKLEKQHPEHEFIVYNGEKGRLGVRKAQYHWGWDWGPVLMTAGPWRLVRLEVYEGRVSDLWTEIEIDKNLKSASGIIFARVEGSAADSVVFSVKLRDNTVLQESVPVDSYGHTKLEVQIKSPELWYPHGYGAQPLYDITAELRTGDFVLD